MSSRSSNTSARPWLYVAAVCAYLLAFRAFDVADNYPMLGEQIRDWGIAQRSFVDLPLVGPRSPNSGLDIGPAYYWVLWAGRVLLAPIAGTLPHVGGWVVATLATLADGALLVAVWRRTGAFWLAAGIVTFAATAAPDAGLSAVVWNPPIAAAFAKLATASVLWPGTTTLGRSLATVLLILGAVQCHPSAVLIALPLLGWTLWALRRDRGRVAVATATLATVLAAAAWASIYIGRTFTPQAASAPPHISVVESLASIAADPLHRLRLQESAHAVSNALQFIFAAPYAAPWFETALLACLAIAIVAAVLILRDGAWIGAGVAPLLTAVAVFSLWQGPFGEAYWFLVIVPATALCFAIPIAALPARLRAIAAIAIIAATAALQIQRWQYVRDHYRLPAYGPLATGIAAATRTGITVRAVTPAFAVPDGMDPLFMFSVAGGHLDPNAPVTLLIRADGSIEFLSSK